jgi:ribosome-associated translation inhibitor RaiA
MKYLVAPFVALALITAYANANPYQATNIAADAKWVIHVDVDAIRDSQIVKKAFDACPELKNAGPVFDLIRGRIGVDLRKDLHGILAYGDHDQKHNVAVVFSTVDRKLLLDMAEKCKDHRVTKHGDIDIHSFTIKHDGKTEPAAGAFYKPDVLVFAADAGQVAKAIDVLSGKAPSLTADSSLPVAGRPVKGATVIVRAMDFPENAKDVVARKAKSIRIAMGEADGKSFYRALLVMKTPEAAEQIKTINEGLKALGALHLSNDKDLMKLVNGLSTTVQQSTVNIRWEVPTSDVWTAIEKVAKKVEEHIKAFKEKREGNKDKDQDKEHDQV